METQTDRPIRKRLGYILIMVFVSIIVGLAGWSFLKSEQHSRRNMRNDEIKAISDLKANQITQWLKERKGDANVIASSPFFAQAVYTWIKNPVNVSLQNQIIERLKLVKVNYGYLDAFLMSTKADVLISTDSIDPDIDPYLIDFIKKPTGINQADFIDLNYSVVNQHVHFDLMMPMFFNQERIALLVLRIQPENYLFPLIQFWPTKSKTSETYIVRKQEDSVLYLSNLRFNNKYALQYKIPLSANETPAVQAVNGHVGFFEGKDYRGVPVISYMVPVTGTCWFMVTKVDKREIYQETYSMAILIGVLTLLAVLLIGTGFTIVNKNRRGKIIQELLKKEIELHRNQEESKVTLYSIGEGVISTDRNGVVTQMNPEAEKLTGWKESDAQGKGIEVVFSMAEAANAAMNNPVHEILGNGMPVEWLDEVWLRSKSGKVFPVTVNGAPIRNEAGTILGAVLAFRDQTGERNARNALLASEEKFRVLFEKSPIGLSMTNTNGVMLVNKAFCDMLGYTEQELLNINWREITHPDDINITEQLADALINGKLSQGRFEKRYKHKSGNNIWAEGLSFLHRDREGHPQFFITSVIDITARRNAEMEILRLNEQLEQRVRDRTAQLEEANKELEAFSYSVSHDLRAPLRHISGYIDLIASRFPDLPGKARHYFDSIADSAHVMGNLIDDLLKFSRTSRQDIQLSKCNMYTMVSEIVESFQQDQPDRSIHWMVSDLPCALADYNLIRLVWFNLISNAVKFTRTTANPEIEIGHQVNETEIQFHVRDNGVGFDMKYASKLFGVFQRLHSSDDFEGTGIGLANVRRIVYRHGGTTWAEGELQKGATFYFTLKKIGEEPK